MAPLFLMSIFLITLSSTTTLHVPDPSYHHEIAYSNSDFLSQPVHSSAFLPFSSTSRIPIDIDYESDSAAGNLFYTGSPAISSVGLFTPNTRQQPAETPGQSQEYRKALEEEAKEAEKEQNRITNNRGAFEGGVKSYVSVILDGVKARYDYGYSV